MTHNCTTSELFTHHQRKSEWRLTDSPLYRRVNSASMHVRKTVESVSAIKITRNTDMRSASLKLKVKYKIDSRLIIFIIVTVLPITIVRTARSHLVSTSIWSLIQKRGWSISCMCQWDYSRWSRHELTIYSRGSNTWKALVRNRQTFTGEDRCHLRVSMKLKMLSEDIWSNCRWIRCYWG